MKLQDVLHFYLGCDFYTPNSQGNLNATTLPHVIDMIESGMKVQLDLRQLSGMTEEEMKEFYCCDCWAHCKIKDITKIGYEQDNANCIRIDFNGQINIASGIRLHTAKLYFNCLSSYQFQWLISRGFDVFNLINQGQAIDSSHSPAPAKQ